MAVSDTAVTAQTDAEIGARFARGEPDAIDDLYIRWAPRVLDFATGIVHDRSLAEDVTQQTFIRAMKARESLRDPSKVHAWLLTIAHNLAVDQLELNRRIRGDGDDALASLPSGDEPEMEVIGHSISDLVWTAAKSLEPRQFTVLNLMLRHDCDAADIAEIMGISTNHAYQLSRRSKEALGNAVRTLLLATSRHDCARLSALLPDDDTTLTPEVHRSIEHHLRRCDGCKSKVAQLTQASALFSAIPLLALPKALANPTRVLHATTASARISDQPLVPATRRQAIGHGTVAALLALLLMIGGVALTSPFGHRVPQSTDAQARNGSVSKPTGIPSPAGLTANEVMARSVTAIEAASSYHVAGSGTPQSSTVNDFAITVARAGDFTGSVSINVLSFSGEQPITRSGGTLYARGDGTTPTSYVSGMVIPNEPMRVFGLTAPQAEKLGTQWFSLSGAAQQPSAKAITSGLAPFDTPAALASALFPSGQTVTFDGGYTTVPLSSTARRYEIVLRRSDGAYITLDPTTFLPTSAELPGLAAVVSFTNWDASTTIGVPSPIMALG